MYQNLIGAILSAIMVISSVLLTWRWFSVVHGEVDPYIILCAFLLTLSLGLLLLNTLYIMRRTVEEIENAKRVVSIGYKEIEERLETKLSKGLRDIEESINDIRRMMYR
ncbi:hypothetical protein [Archaeoglobus profundus]|uniref:Uncharacterized protein n=1 Tax=Archaeoglobus profundus (strain DSM 5631 / JCM 9629 / NBRC 100127 / Av18) TaxID=572546 RepID=D2RFL6_ARCPA|nr:hypothetical protein [Archaeoglobus profundus]ADB57091.1 hypothetical protein Arcpr_0013 [Archaeoglobus profundus DSM 5631]